MVNMVNKSINNVNVSMLAYILLVELLQVETV